MLLLFPAIMSALQHLTFTQPIDHFDPIDNFSQSYFVLNPNPSHTTILVIGGWESFNPSLLTSPGISALASRIGAQVIGIEHRFFGSSIPSNPLPYSALTVRQALADIASFISAVLPTTKVIVAGVGTGGSLAAWFRLKYPRLSTAAWVSSAPLLAAMEHQSVDLQVRDRLASVSDGCAEKERDLLGEAERILSGGSPDRVDSLLAEFHLTSASAPSFLKIVSDMLEELVLNASLFSRIESWCVDQEWDLDGMARLFEWGLEQLRIENASSLDPRLPPIDAVGRDRRAALRLQCTEVGWFRTAASGGVKPPALSAQWYRDLCLEVFGRSGPVVVEFNREFGGRVPAVESTVFVGNKGDVWAAFEAEGVDGRVNETVAFATSGINGADWLAPEELGRDEVLKRLAEWAAFECGCEPDRGECRLHTCVCRDGWGGENCTEKMAPYEWFARMRFMATIIPTVMVLVTSVVAWKVLVKEADRKPVASDGGASGKGRWAQLLQGSDRI
jgi:pimeloyl-ACP methyl ester carboxylesterase